MSRQSHVVVIGSINMDLVVRCSTLPRPGQTITAESLVEVSGGKGANQAVAAARAGGHVSMVGKVGGDAFSERLLANLKDNGVNCDCVGFAMTASSGVAVVAVESSGENSILVVPGANGEVSVADIEPLEALIADADIVLLQLEIPVETVVAAIGMARRLGTRVLLDPAPAPAPTAIPQGLFDVDLLCPNESEAAAILGRRVESQAEAMEAAAELAKMGPRAVALTMGERGTLLAVDGHVTHIPPVPVLAVDTTAAGDAFAGSLAVYWSETDDLFESTRFASAAGALAASRSGAQPSLPHRNEIESFRSCPS